VAAVVVGAVALRGRSVRERHVALEVPLPDEAPG
jgi:hypothetical protein